MILLKFGKKEHLQQLANGCIHFRPLQTFVNDSTPFRGDQLEASILADPKGHFEINGLDISPYISELRFTFDGFDSILSFSASQITPQNCHMKENGIFALNDNFIHEMKQFGTHVLVFNSEHFISNLMNVLSFKKCNILYHPICYYNKTNYNSAPTYLTKIQPYTEYNICFLKDTKYSLQNEWRIIIHDIASEFPIESSGGVNIYTEFYTAVPIFNVDDLKTLSISSDLL